jgi:flagellar biosynthesis GTPase FlhF
MVECVIRHQLPVLFMANGQRVPEDLHVPNTGYLSTAVCGSKQALREVPLSMTIFRP